MSARDVTEALYVWTPFLAGGFIWNVLVSLCAMAIGTLLGAVLATMRLSHRRATVRASLVATGLTRNIPTFVFLFYLAFLIPVEIELGGHLYAFPAWLKASLALAVAVIGFVSDNLSEALRRWRSHDHAAALMFIPNWTSYFLVIVMASSTASVIGVGELVARCNTVIGAVGKPELMLWIYLYAMLWFFLCCYPLTLLMRQVKTWMSRRLPQRTPELVPA
ncbi:MAG: polar amino acid ABC transporter permease [Alphaproteobacteria bacterium]|nr:polar amino acid ABC transporter permease [Alphaproteobacteria bacterium]